MKHMTKDQIGKLVRRVITMNTGKSSKSMHLDSRLYHTDAEGAYPKNYSGKNLDIDIGNLEHIILDFEDQLNIDFNIPGEWRDPKSYKDTPIRYHKDTRLHHLIDFVHDTYNKAVAKSEPDNSTNNMHCILNNEGNLDTYYAKIVKDGHTLYAVTGEDTFAWSTNKLDFCLFSAKDIHDIFDLKADDVIATAKPSDIGNFLREVVPPFELSFVHIKEDSEDNDWTYTEDDRVDQILNKLPPEEAELVRSKLK